MSTYSFSLTPILKDQSVNRRCHGNLETVAMRWLNEGARRCATMGPARDCANRDTSVYPGSGPSTPEVKPLLPACFVLS
jgi:hypothetical protein